MNTVGNTHYLNILLVLILVIAPVDYVVSVRNFT
jgi:hypothetical protein